MIASNMEVSVAQQPQPSRGDETRNLLLDAGLNLFAVHGFDGVTTRQLARESGANVAAIAYHFGGKRELYRAILQQLVEDTEPFLGPGVAALRDGVRAANGDQEQAEPRDQGDDEH